MVWGGTGVHSTLQEHPSLLMTQVPQLMLTQSYGRVDVKSPPALCNAQLGGRRPLQRGHCQVCSALSRHPSTHISWALQTPPQQEGFGQTPYVQ